MKKTFILEGLDCANCAAKIETQIKNLAGVSNAAVDFVSKKLTIEVANEKGFNGIIEEATAIVKKIEPDVKVVNSEKSKGNKSVVLLEGLDCANCAAKIEAEVKKLEGVTFASVDFVSTKLTLETGPGVNISELNDNI
jgi:Cd2+/Zn2+-exporting ATPase